MLPLLLRILRMNWLPLGACAICMVPLNSERETRLEERL